MADADDKSTKYADIDYKGNNGTGIIFPSGQRVSFAMYSVDAAGNKSVARTEAVAP
ncbi:hypothetical protein J31TS6_10520 [Brevibacillus reuszeri]|nr:hypothetical protein J31TS6_10520 [Brevibacillus reuszeri]